MGGGAVWLLAVVLLPKRYDATVNAVYEPVLHAWHASGRVAISVALGLLKAPIMHSVQLAFDVAP